MGVARGFTIGFRDLRMPPSVCCNRASLCGNVNSGWRAAAAKASDWLLWLFMPVPVTAVDDFTPDAIVDTGVIKLSALDAGDTFGNKDSVPPVAICRSFEMFFSASWIDKDFESRMSAIENPALAPEVGESFSLAEIPDISEMILFIFYVVFTVIEKRLMLLRSIRGL